MNNPKPPVPRPEEKQHYRSKRAGWTLDPDDTCETCGDFIGWPRSKDSEMLSKLHWQSYAEGFEAGVAAAEEAAKNPSLF